MRLVFRAAKRLPEPDFILGTQIWESFSFANFNQSIKSPPPLRGYYYCAVILFKDVGIFYIVDIFSIVDTMVEDPFSVAVENLEKKHFLSISRELLKSPDPLGFNAFLKNIPQITPRILSTRLKEMEKEGIITKSITMARPQMKIEYRLTARGRALKGTIDAINKWGKSLP